MARIFWMSDRMGRIGFLYLSGLPLVDGFVLFDKRWRALVIFSLCPAAMICKRAFTAFCRWVCAACLAAAESLL